MKINGQTRMEALIAGLEGVPRLLLHSCCAPCSSYVIEALSEHFRITVFYYNPNIDPQEEYQRRAAEQRRFLSEYQKCPVEFLEGEFEPQAFHSACLGYEAEPEGGMRCARCFRLRLEKTAQLAKAKGFDYFGTTLSVSPHKNAPLINQIGGDIEKEWGVPFLYADFKKKNGYGRSTQLANQYNLYRQNYCGCKYSRAQRGGGEEGGGLRRPAF